MPKAPPKLQQSAAREGILRAASAVFAEEGFGGARVDVIARRAGVNKAMLYYHVGDKAALYEAVLLQVLSGAWKDMERAAGADRSPEERLRGVLRAVSTMAASSPDYPKLFLRELATGGANLPEPVMRQMAGIAGLVKSALQEGAEAGVFRSTDPLMTHLAILGGVMALTVSGPIRKKLLSRGIEVAPGNAFTQEIPEFMTELLLDGLGPAPSRQKKRIREVRP